MPNSPQLVLVFGGTFDPPHAGHLRAVLEVQQQLKACLVKLVPCYLPPHKTDPSVAASGRAEMLHLALEELNQSLNTEGLFEVDKRELDRERPSYTYDTLSSLRCEFPEAVLVWMLGMDSFNTLDSWYRWEELLGLASLLVVARPGDCLQEEALVSQHFADKQVALQDISVSKSGGVAFMSTTGLAISSSDLRHKLANNEPTDYLLPKVVADYIKGRSLYGKRP